MIDLDVATLETCMPYSGASIEALLNGPGQRQPEQEVRAGAGEYVGRGALCSWEIEMLCQW
jgi:hypothetical protein